MVARLNRNSPLPSGSPPRVQDGVTQRALDAIWTPLSAILKFLQPFVQPERVQPAQFVTGWGNLGVAYNAAGSKKDPLGRVHLQGVVWRSSGVLQPIMLLPLHHRPSKNVIFIAVSNNVDCRVDVTAEGVVTYILGGNPGSYISLDGLSFDTER